jgi:hypothetical protein
LGKITIKYESIMKKSILELKGMKVLSKNEQIAIVGSGGCPISWCCGGHGEPPCQEN